MQALSFLEIDPEILAAVVHGLEMKLQRILHTQFSTRIRLDSTLKANTADPKFYGSKHD